MIEMIWLALRANENLFFVAIVFDLLLVVDLAYIFVHLIFLTKINQVGIIPHIFLLLNIELLLSRADVASNIHIYIDGFLF